MRLLLLVASMMAVAATQTPPAPPAQAPATPTILKSGSAIIVGRVVEAGTTTGVAAATVTLSSAALGIGQPTSRFSDGTPAGARRIVTDSDGRFMFHGLPAGSYSLMSAAPGWVSGTLGATFTRRSLVPPRSLDLTDADRTVSVTIQMSRPGGMSGRVLDEAGEPMVNAPVSVLARIVEGGRVRTETTQTVMTDDRGMYHADDLPGEYFVAVIATTTTVPAAAVDGFNQAQREGGATFQAYMSQIIRSGALLPRGVGARVGDFLVTQYGQRNAWVVPPITTLDGRAVFYPTTFHPSSPSASGASAVTIGSGEEKTGIDIVMRPQPARRVTGRVIADGSPQGSVAIRLVAPDMAASDAGRYPVNNDTPQALTDGNGNFTFIGIAPGLYTARVLMSSATPADPILWAADPVVVGADADVTDLQIRLRSGARISGRVVADPASPPLSAADYRTFGIRAEPLPGTAGSLMGGIDWMTRINENGQLTTGEYVPGSYVIRVLGVPSGWTVQSATIGGRDAIDRPFELPSAGASDLVITVVNRQTQIAGHVRDANGQPAPYTTVAVLPGDRSMWPAGGLTARRMAMIASGRDGKYTLRGLPAGEYVLAAFGSQGLDLWDQRVLTTLAASATRITIADGESRTQDLVVRR